jgi:hypothetical protein
MAEVNAVTVEEALKALPAALNLANKLAAIITTSTPMSCEEEVAALNAARMRPSDEIIGAADSATP